MWGATGTPSVAGETEEADVDDRARIVVGVDGSECARAALEFALAEAGRRDAELEVVSVVAAVEARRGDPPVVGVGLLDVKSGSGPFAMYRSAAVAGIRRQAPTTGLRGDDNQRRLPAPAR